MPHSNSERIANLVSRNVDLCAKRGRADWPKYIYHQAPLPNAVGILTHRKVYSRNLADSLGLLIEDAASPSVIENSRRTHDYARFYFRPLTPTFFKREGLIVRTESNSDAHCAMPFYFRFHATCLLSHPQCEFTDSNFARHHVETQRGVDALEQLPFADIYHDGPNIGPRKDVITGAKSAEVLFLNEVGIDCLHDVVARTGPERATLLAALPKNDRQFWRDRIVVESISHRLFFPPEAYRCPTRLFVKEISYDRVHVSIKLSARSRAPVLCRMEVLPHVASHEQSINAVGHVQFAVGDLGEKIPVRLELDGLTMFQGWVTSRELY